MADTLVHVGGEDVLLCPELAMYWPARRTLLIADTHFGKAATFRTVGVPVPHGTTAHALSRLTALLHRHDPQRLIILGDFLHAAEGRTPGTLDALAAWRDANPALSITLVRGNHDRHAGDPPGALRIDCVPEPMAEPPYVFAHRPAPSSAGYTLAGHIHPAAILAGGGRQRLRLSCFWFGPSVGVLPAFGDFTGRAEIAPQSTDQVFVVADGAVHRVT